MSLILFTLIMIWCYSNIEILDTTEKEVHEVQTYEIPKVRHVLEPEEYLATHDENILIYNRVPKTGSSSMRTMLINLVKVCGQYLFHSSHTVVAMVFTLHKDLVK